MRIKIDQVPEEGLELHLDQGDAWALKAAQEALEGPVRDLRADLHVDLIAEVVRVHGSAQATVRRTCDRCGGEVDLHVGGDVELIYEPTPHPALHDEVITDEAELDIGYFDGKALEIGDVLMEQLALWTPPRVRCGEPGVQQVGEPWECRLPDQEPGPDLTRHNPFANLRLPE